MPIILSWFVSPVLTGIGSAIIFGSLRFLVLRRENSYGKSFWVLPPAVMLTTWINVYFVFTRVSGHGPTHGSMRNSQPAAGHEPCRWCLSMPLACMCVCV